MRQEMEPVHLEQQLELRQRQLQEIAGTFRVSHVIPCQRGTMVGHWAIAHIPQHQPSYKLYVVSFNSPRYFARNLFKRTLLFGF